MKRIFFLSILSSSLLCSANATNPEPGTQETADTTTTEDVVTALVISNAVQGDPEAQYLYGNCYYYGNGEIKSFEKAIGWWNMAAEQDYGPAITDLGFCHMVGEGVEADSTKALELFSRAADLDYAPAKFWAGYCYKYGIGTPIDHKKANDLFEQAAQSYVAMAMFELGDSYERGLGCKPNTSRAIKYYEEAAASGEESAAKRLKELKDDSDADPDRAIKLFQDKINKGNKNKKAGKDKQIKRSNPKLQEYEDSQNNYI